ncbi:hypothetical protein NMY22_g8634 [Coprinellus aureogranulatus]|nr:hypothetical protein NMY22_g8634 [Coprinellus aureogranulatus]
MTYAGVRKAGRYAYKKCHPEAESSTSQETQRVINANEKYWSPSHPRTKKELNTHAKHRSHDMASSITQVQEPEKAYSTDMSFTVRTSQPTPIDPMNLPPDFVPKPVFKAPAPAHVKRSSVQSNSSSQAPIMPLPYSTRSNYDHRTSRRQSDSIPHMIERGSGMDGAIHSQRRSTDSGQDQRTPR